MEKDLTNFEDYYHGDYKPEWVNEKWANDTYIEWSNIYEKFIKESEEFIERIGKDKIQVLMRTHPRILRSFAIKFL